MQAQDYFPLKLAKGNRFCNRIEERALLKHNIQLARPTVLVSPRRYGKSSLVHRVVEEMMLPCAYIDLFLAHNDKAITRRILDGIGKLLSHMMTPTQKTAALLQKLFTHIKIGLHVSGFELQVGHDSPSVGAVEQIYDTLRALSYLAKTENKKAIIFIDEFQDIQNAESASSIQGAIRNIAQDTDALEFIFSGSNRGLLLQIFDDRAKPLYMLCDKINLERMSSDSYKPYIQEAAQEKWGIQLSDPVLRKIMVLTELHPFYVNMLSHEIFKAKTPPDENQVIQAWHTCYQAEHRRLISEIKPLAFNQQKLLKYLAANPTAEPYSIKVSTEVGLSSSSTKGSLEQLVKKDFIDQVTQEDPWVPSLRKGDYRVLDPLFAYSLRQYS